MNIFVSTEVDICQAADKIIDGIKISHPRKFQDGTLPNDY